MLSHNEEKETQYIVRPIGFVHNEVVAPTAPGFNWSRVVSRIEINSELTEALDGLEEFSHILVLFWFHRISPSSTPLKIHPQGRQDLPLVGLFATATPNRPNRIGRTMVRLLERRGNILVVEGLDAIDGTPVIDIKSFNPRYDNISDARVAEWTKKS